MKKLFLFLINFLLFSFLFYVLWIFLKNPYSTLLGNSFGWFAGLFGLSFPTTVASTNITIAVSSTRSIKIETIALIANMITLMSLVMATPNMKWSKKLILLPITAFFLFLFHLFSLVVILGAFGITKETAPHLGFLKVLSKTMFSFSEQIGKIVISFVIWLLFANREVFGKINEPNKIFNEKTKLDSGNIVSEGEKKNEKQSLE